MLSRPSQRVLVSFLLLSVCFISARADISRSQARKAILRMGNFELPSSSVNVASVNSTAADTAEASADLQLVFRLVQDKDGVWRIAEIRTAQDTWEEVGVLASVASFTVPKTGCQAVNSKGRADTDLNPKAIRCLVANLFGINVPSDEVRVKDFSSLDLPVGISVDFPFLKIIFNH